MKIEFIGLPSDKVAQIRATGLDAYGNRIERATAADQAQPCRHCLRPTATGAPYLTLAHRPFETSNPYAETGPIFLCAKACPAHPPASDLPEILTAPSHILRGYSVEERIVYGTGRVVATEDAVEYARTLLARDDIAFVDVRSASNNCFLCRIRPAS